MPSSMPVVYRTVRATKAWFVSWGVVCDQPSCLGICSTCMLGSLNSVSKCAMPRTVHRQQAATALFWEVCASNNCTGSVNQQQGCAHGGGVCACVTHCCTCLFCTVGHRPPTTGSSCFVLGSVCIQQLHRVCQPTTGLCSWWWTLTCLVM
jgi:hypothetical protein